MSPELGGRAQRSGEIHGKESMQPVDPLQLHLPLFEKRHVQTAGHEIALRLGWICRALNWHRFASRLLAPHREEYLQGVGLRLRMMLAGFD